MAIGVNCRDIYCRSVTLPGIEGDVGLPEIADDPVAQLVRTGVGAGYLVTDGPVWLMVTPAGAELAQHGWKLHVSARAAALPDLVRAILPVLVGANCTFKLARTCQVLAELNDGVSSPATVGKAVTIYPDQHLVAALGRELARLLAGWPGPRVLSDRRVAPSAPVYYRYGPIAANWEADPLGRLKAQVHGPFGEVFDGTATLAYRQPSWATDPFTGATGDQPGTDATIVGGHYEITAGLRLAAQGNVYRAVDQRDGRPVVIKQARALVAESQGRADTRLRLRNERRVLQVLAGVAGVPRFLDHFQHGDDEFLVTSDCGPANLGEDLLNHGPYQVGADGPRRLAVLATGLARILGELHDRGVIIRDLSPKNVVIGEAGPHVLDFGIASYDGLHLPGATLGYAPARQQAGEPPAETDDYYALGMTLLFAATGLEPVSVGDDPGQAQVRALQTIASAFGERPAGTAGLIADLLSDGRSTARAAFGRLRTGQLSDRRQSTAPLPVIGAFGQELAAELAGPLLADLIKGAAELLTSSSRQPAAHDASIYRGSSGIGLELLAHPGTPGVAELLSDLAAFSVAAAERVRLPPGLFLGTTGVSIFLRQAAASGIAVPTPPWDGPGADWQPASNDLIAGAAGVGLGHLWLYQADGDPAHLAVAFRCAQHLMADAAQESSSKASAKAAAGVDPATGRAHGLAGETEFLLALAAQTGDQAIATAATRRCWQLAERTRALLPQVRAAAAAPISVSWCQGLAGIGPVLLLGRSVLGDEHLAELARDVAGCCIARVPRLSALGRCCGAAGVGNFLIDLAVATQHEQYWQAARDVGRHMLLRSGGSARHPAFVRDAADHSDIAWAFGIAGLLPFFRRLAQQAGPDSLPLPGPRLRPAAPAPAGSYSKIT
jgi:tRNA A-37 threonylcarbamoyl transferase component Bud32